MRRAVAAYLVTRNSADKFFNSLEKSRPVSATLDFSHVTFVSRSFADEYTRRRAKTRIKITEANKPNEVERMFSMVAKQQRHRVKPEVRRIKVFTL